MTMTDGRVRFGLFDFDRRSGELRRDGDVVKLPPQPGRVLALLLDRPGELILREELRTHLWGDDTFVDFERGLNFCILQVRTALGDSSDNPRFVQTVPRKGYRFIAPVRVVATPPPLQIAPTQPGAGASVAMAVAAMVIALALVGGLAWRVGDRARPPVVPESPARVAVLPFVNLTGDANAEDLADGLTDEVISQLGRLGAGHVAVIARTSAMAYRNSGKTVGVIGRELNARFVVESSVRRDNGVLRITSNLVPVEQDSPSASWSEVFGNGPGAGDTQTAAATRLARLVALELTPRGTPVEAPVSTTSDAAWDAMLRGRAAINRGTPADVRQAIAEFESAVRHDRSLAAGWARIAEAHHQLVMMGSARPRDAYPVAANAAARALAADPQLADAYVAHGVVRLWYDRDPSGAAAAFERALALNPSHAVAHHDYAWALVAAGRDDDAIAEIAAARDLDPLSTRANNDVGWLYLHLRRPADAIRACEHTLAIDPRSLEAQACLERAYVQQGMYDAALRAAAAALPSGTAPASPAANDGDAEAQLKALWRHRLARLEDIARTRWVSPYMLATLHVMAGEADRALDLLERAVDEQLGMLVFLNRDPAVDPLRQHPRFQALQARLAPESR